jgi:hypothetical protein
LSWSGIGLVAAALLATSAHAESTDPIKIGVIAEVQSIAGAATPGGAQIAADEINAKGGILGRKIQIVTYDNKSSSADSVRAFQRGVRRQGLGRDRKLYQRGRAGARALGGAAEDAPDHAGRRLQRDHQGDPQRL